MTRQKGARWKRGSACSSNPSSKKHRTAAAAALSSKRQGTAPGQLSAEALHAFNEEQGDSMQGDEGSVISGTKISALSTWTVASNVTGKLEQFERVRKLWNSPLDSHKEMCAVLAAITEVITAQGEEESPIAYFAALLTALEATVQLEQQTAITYLLSLVVPSVPSTILRSKFSAASKLLHNVITTQHNKDASVALMKSLLSSLCYILSQQDPAVWGEVSVVKMFEHLVQFVYHSKPKLRHSAQRNLSNLGKDCPAAATLALNACTNNLNNYTGSKEAQVTLYTISFIRYVLPHCTESEVRGGCEALLRVITLRHTQVTSAALQALTHFFKKDCSAITGEMQGQIILNLYEAVPTNLDHPITTVWLEAISAGYSNLANTEPKLGIIMSGRLYSTCSDAVLSKNAGVVQAALVALEEFNSTNLALGLEAYEGELSEQKKTPLSKVVTTLDTMVKLTYQHVWDVVLQVIGSLFQNITSSCLYMFRELIPKICIIRNAPDFENTTLFSQTIGHIVKCVGVQEFLEIYPLLIESGNDVMIPNGWMLPILRDNVEKAELSFYVDKLVPITAALKIKSESHKNSGNTLDSRVCFNLEYQIWNLLPSFCKSPTDLMTSFKKIAKTLGNLLTQRIEIRNIICTSITQLVKSSKLNDEAQAEIARFAKNYIPILFNIFLAEPAAEDPPINPVIECIREYMAICPKDTLHGFFEKVVERSGSESTTHTQQALLELIVAMIPYLSLQDLNTMYSTIVPWLSDDGDNTKQKRAYQILCTILEGYSEHHVAFVAEHLEELYKQLAESLALAKVSSKKHRLKCLLGLIKKLTVDNFSFIPTILPEIILCVKTTNEKSRVAAYKCLVAIGFVLVEKSEDKTEAIRKYFEMVIAGLTGDTELASATLLCLGKLVYEYHTYLNETVLDQVLEIVTALMQSKQREVLKGVLSFLKASIGTISYRDFQPHVQNILLSFGDWEKATKHHFRAKVRVILERLLRRFGYEMIHKLATDEHKKVVNAIVKEQRRAKRDKLNRHLGRDQGSDNNDDDEEEGVEEFKALKGKGSKKPLTAHISEGENPMDFLDNSMIPNIYQGTKEEPCTAPERDGKLVIEDFIQKLNDTHISDGEEDPEDEIVTAAVNPFGRPKKGIYRNDKKNKSDGSDYKSKKAEGDVKKSGKQDPYAYVSLKQQKGKKNKSGQFDNLIKAGKKGAMKGGKAKPRK